jgi:hypothetical protein
MNINFDAVAGVKLTVPEGARRGEEGEGGIKGGVLALEAADREVSASVVGRRLNRGTDRPQLLERGLEFQERLRSTRGPGRSKARDCQDKKPCRESGAMCLVRQNETLQEALRRFYRVRSAPLRSEAVEALPLWAEEAAPRPRSQPNDSLTATMGHGTSARVMRALRVRAKINCTFCLSCDRMWPCTM